MNVETIGGRKFSQQRESRGINQPVFDIRQPTTPGTPESDFDHMPRQQKERFMQSLKLFGVSLLGAMTNYKETLRHYAKHKVLLRA